MNDQRLKADAGKAKPDLLFDGFPNALRLVQATLEYGAHKYEEHSWRVVPDGIRRYNRAAGRHLQDRKLMMASPHSSGCNLLPSDAESHLPHIAHEVFNLLAIMELELQANPHLYVDVLCKFAPPPTAHKQAEFSYAHQGEV